jgi:chemotaxis protein methyltransferase CheR
LDLSRQRYDIVFCRNALIYFDRSNQRRVIASLIGHMNADSYLFLGHSETMLSFDLPLRSVAHSVYRKK